MLMENSISFLAVGDSIVLAKISRQLRQLSWIRDIVFRNYEKKRF